MLTHNILPRDKGFRQFYSFYKNFLTHRAEDGPETTLHSVLLVLFKNAFSE
jgi:hypothetical protein